MDKKIRKEFIIKYDYAGNARAYVNRKYFTTVLRKYIRKYINTCCKDDIQRICNKLSKEYCQNHYIYDFDKNIRIWCSELSDKEVENIVKTIYLNLNKTYKK